MKIVSLLSLLLIGFSAQAADAISLKSRNMPTHCSYVFEVNSEIQINIQNPEQPVSELLVSYLNEYTKVWSDPALIVVSQQGSASNIFYATAELKSMSTNPKYLIRKIKFAIVTNPANSASGWYQSEFGRAFGERCFNTPKDTPFRDRSVLFLGLQKN